jgi:triphosphatase
MTGLIQPNTAEAGGLTPLGIVHAPTVQPDARAPGPAGVRLVQIPSATTAHDACAVLLALHGASIEQNLASTLASIDPEGPHQLRVALRRLRVLLRVFKPIMAKRVNAALATTARDIGRIAGELRDADVMIDQLLSPSAVRVADRAVIGALNGWRQELRGRVRAKLTAASAAGFAKHLSDIAAGDQWRRKLHTRGDERAADFMRAASADFVASAARAGSHLPALSHADLHTFRKTA